MKLPAVNNAQSSLQYFLDSDIIENCNDTVLVPIHNYADFSVDESKFKALSSLR